MEDNVTNAGEHVGTATVLTTKGKPFANEIMLWDAMNTQVLWSVSCKNCMSLKFCPSVNKLFAVDNFKAITCWDVSSGAMISLNIAKQCAACIPSNNGTRVLVQFHSILEPSDLWDVEQSTYLFGIDGVNYAAICFSDDDSNIVASDSNAIRVWDTDCEVQLVFYNGLSTPGRQNIRACGRSCAVYNNGEFGVWEIRTGAVLFHAHSDSHITSLCFANDGEFVAVAKGTNFPSSFECWRLEDSSLVFSVTPTAPVTMMAWSPCTLKFYTYSNEERVVREHDAESGCELSCSAMYDTFYSMSAPFIGNILL
jgi:WD40 repeat protein